MFRKFCAFFGLFLTAFLAGCNGRPTYNIHLLDLETWVDGHSLTKVAYDPEPDDTQAIFEPASQSEVERLGLALAAESNVGVTLTFACGGTCFFDKVKVRGFDFDCVCPPPCQAAGDANLCRARTKTYAFRYPSRGAGFEKPHAEKGRDITVEEYEKRARGEEHTEAEPRQSF